MVLDPLAKRLRAKQRLIGALVILGLLALLLGWPDARSFLNKNAGAASAALSFMLVVLYVGQYGLLDRQIQLENRPHLVIEEFDEEGNSIRAELSNLGNGVATDIELETTIDFEIGGEHGPGSGRIGMRKVGAEGDEKTRVGNALEAGRAHEMFVGDAVTGLTVDGEEEGWGLRAATGRLAAEGVEIVTVDFAIVSSDMLGNEQRATIYGWPYEVELDDLGVGVEEVVTRGRPAIPGWEEL